MHLPIPRLTFTFVLFFYIGSSLAASVGSLIPDLNVTPDPSTLEFTPVLSAADLDFAKDEDELVSPGAVGMRPGAYVDDDGVSSARRFEFVPRSNADLHREMRGWLERPGQLDERELARFGGSRHPAWEHLGGVGSGRDAVLQLGGVGSRRVGGWYQVEGANPQISGNWAQDRLGQGYRTPTYPPRGYPTYEQPMQGYDHRTYGYQMQNGLASIGQGQQDQPAASARTYGAYPSYFHNPYGTSMHDPHYLTLSTSNQYGAAIVRGPNPVDRYGNHVSDPRLAYQPQAPHGPGVQYPNPTNGPSGALHPDARQYGAPHQYEASRQREAPGQHGALNHVIDRIVHGDTRSKMGSTDSPLMYDFMHTEEGVPLRKTGEGPDSPGSAGSWTGPQNSRGGY
ncbi:hypothetical protein ACQY0O_000594 [Thecaphora frezii]